MFGLWFGFSRAIEHFMDVGPQNCNASIRTHTVFNAHGFEDPDLSRANLAFSQDLDLFLGEKRVSRHGSFRIDQFWLQPKNRQSCLEPHLLERKFVRQGPSRQKAQ